MLKHPKSSTSDAIGTEEVAALAAQVLGYGSELEPRPAPSGRNAASTGRVRRRGLRPGAGRRAGARVIRRFTGRQSLALLRALDVDETNPGRLKALEGLAVVAPKVAPENAAALAEQVALLLRGEDESFHGPAVEAMQAFRGAASQALLLAHLKDAEQTKPIRATIARRLANTQSGALGLLGLVEAGELPGDLERDVREAVHASPYDDVRMMAQQLLLRRAADGVRCCPWPNSRGAIRAGAPFSARTPPSATVATKSARRAKGLDLTVIGQKLAGGLESISYPNAAISHEYGCGSWRPNGGAGGFIVGEDDNAVQLMDERLSSRSRRKGLDRRKTS